MEPLLRIGLSNAVAALLLALVVVTVADKLCGGSLTPLLAPLMRTRRLTADERRDLRTLLDQLDREEAEGR